MASAGEETDERYGGRERGLVFLMRCGEIEKGLEGIIEQKLEGASPWMFGNEY